MKLHLKYNINDGTYYTCAKPFSYGLHNMFITGGRGIGKTTAFLNKGLSNCLDNPFIYTRRYKGEMKEFIQQDVLNKMVDEEITYKGDKHDGVLFIYENHIIGRGMIMSHARSYKSSDFKDYNMMIYDEAIIDRSNTDHYISNEVEVWLGLISTIQRTRPNFFSVILGNNEDLFNPWYSYFNVPTFDRIYTNRDKDLYCELAKHSPKLLELEKKTSLYKLTQGTSFADYHYENKGLRSIKPVISSKPKECSLLNRVIMNNVLINLYSYNDNHGRYSIFCEDREKVFKDDRTYIIMENGQPNYFYTNMFKDRYKNFLYRMFYDKRITYSSQKSADVMVWLIQNI